MARKLTGVLCTSGMQGPKGEKGDSYVITEKDYEEIAELVPNSLPKGGTTNQILQKKSDTDYDAEWVDNQADGKVKSVNGQTGEVNLTADDVGATTEQWVKAQGYLTQHQDLSGYVTETELENKGYLVSDDISNLASKTELQAVENKIPSLNGYATEQYVNDKVDSIDLSPYAKKTEIPTKTSQLENDSNFLTEHQSLDNYYTKSETDTQITNAINSIVNGNEVSY